MGVTNKDKNFIIEIAGSHKAEDAKLREIVKYLDLVFPEENVSLSEDTYVGYEYLSYNNQSLNESITFFISTKYDMQLTLDEPDNYFRGY